MQRCPSLLNVLAAPLGSKQLILLRLGHGSYLYLMVMIGSESYIHLQESTWTVLNYPHWRLSLSRMVHIDKKYNF